MSAMTKPPPASRWAPSQWRDAIDGAASEIARYALGFADSQVGAPTAPEAAAAMVGAHVPLVGGGHAFDLALVASPDDCAALSRAILGAAPNSKLSDNDVADAVGEITNMLGGAVKRRMTAHGADLELGLPVFIHGHVHMTSRVAVIAMPARLGPIDALVLVIGPRQ